MPGPPAPCFYLCHLLSSADFLLSALLPVAPAVRTLGSCAAWFIATSHLDLGAKQAGRTRSCLLEEKDKRKIYALKAVPILRQTYANFLAY